MRSASIFFVHSFPAPLQGGVILQKHGKKYEVIVFARGLDVEAKSGRKKKHLTEVARFASFLRAYAMFEYYARVHTPLVYDIVEKLTRKFVSKTSGEDILLGWYEPAWLSIFPVLKHRIAKIAKPSQHDKVLKGLLIRTMREEES